MKFNSIAQERSYKKAVNVQYKAVAFDVDGTLTPFGRIKIPDYLLATLSSLPIDMPLVICTGRPIEFIYETIDMICNAADNNSSQRERWWIIAENGGAGYFYDKNSDQYQQFFQEKWPNEIIEIDELGSKFKEELGWPITVLEREFSLVMHFPKWMYIFPRLCKYFSNKFAKKIHQHLIKFNLNNHFSVQDSGLGVLVLPTKVGKGNAIHKFAKKIDIPMKAILSIGDSPQLGGNDEDFLSGKYGIGFSVGCMTNKTYPLPVFNDKGVRLNGPKGTNQLLKSIFKI